MNTELLTETLEYIKAHPEEWNQSKWRCETGMCFAGHAAVLAGGRWLHAMASAFDYQSDYMVAESDDPLEEVFSHGVDLDSAVYSSQRAERVLGLTFAQANVLFQYNNTLEDLERMVADLIAGRDITGSREAWL